LSVGKRNNIGMKEVLKRVMILDTMNLVNMIMVREMVVMTIEVMTIEVMTMIMNRVRMLLTKMKGVEVAVILRHILKMMTMTMMMTTSKWVRVIYLSH
jgi:hypothetical protein